MFGRDCLHAGFLGGFIAFCTGYENTIPLLAQVLIFVCVSCAYLGVSHARRKWIATRKLKNPEVGYSFTNVTDFEDGIDGTGNKKDSRYKEIPETTE